MGSITRREAIAASAGLAGALLLPGTGPAPLVRAAGPGRLKQSVCRWAWGGLSLDRLCRAGKALGLAGIDLLNIPDWQRVVDYGLLCTMGYPADRPDFNTTGFNDRRHHPMLLRELEGALPLAARHGIPNLLAMVGNREGRSDADGIAACAEGLRQIAPLAEEQGVTICVELLNSRVDHKDYQGDHTAFGLAVLREVGSPRVRLLYDIYHMQIMEGDIIRTIRDHLPEIGHFHTGGVPGRHELDGSQELQYPAIARAIADAGFTGYLAHEFEPTGNPIASLRQAVEACRV